MGATYSIVKLACVAEILYIMLDDFCRQSVCVHPTYSHPDHNFTVDL